MESNQSNTASDNLYKYKKIGAMIPKLISDINHLEMLDKNIDLNLDLIRSKKRLSTIVTNTPSPSETEINEFTSALAQALYSLTDGLKAIKIGDIAEEKRSKLIDILAEISLIQEDIIKYAG